MSNYIKAMNDDFGKNTESKEKEYEVYVRGVFTILSTSQEDAERWVKENLGSGELLNSLEIDDGKQG